MQKGDIKHLFEVLLANTYCLIDGDPSCASNSAARHCMSAALLDPA